MYEQRSLQASNVKHIANYNREQLRPKGDDIVYSHIKLRLNETKSQSLITHIEIKDRQRTFTDCIINR